MASIQFGWALNAETPQSMTPSQYRDGVQRQLELVGPQVDSLWFVDHVQFGDSPLLEGWTALTYLCSRVSTVPGGAHGTLPVLSKSRVACQDGGHTSIFEPRTFHLQHRCGLARGRVSCLRLRVSISRRARRPARRDAPDREGSLD